MKKLKGFAISLIAFFFLSTLSPVFALEQRTVTGLGLGQDIRAELVLPDGRGLFPGVLILHTPKGVGEAEIAFARRLAEEGFACLVPYYLETSEGRETGMDGRDEEVFADLVSGVRYMMGHPLVDPERIGAVGSGLGGYWALVLAAKGKVQAGVSDSGALSPGFAEDGAYRFTAIFGSLSSPVLLLQGSDEPADLAENLSSLLAREQVPHELSIYAGAGLFNAGASEDSFRKTLEFLKKHLGR